MRRRGLHPQRAFTLVELLIAVALAAVVASLAGPSMYSFVLAQRLKGTNASLITDLQYARSEAVAHGKNVWVIFRQVSSMSCYTMYTDQSNTGTGHGKCNCTLAPGARCEASATELKTVQVPGGLSVRFSIDTTVQTNEFAFDSVTGSMYAAPSDLIVPAGTAFVVDTMIDTSHILRTRIGQSGRPTVCLPSGSSVSGGYPAC